MKQLIFIDNNDEFKANNDFISVKRFMENFAKMPDDILDNSKVISNIASMDKGALRDILFDEKNVIVTFSSYFGDSAAQIKYFLAAASRNDVSNKIFIDAAGTLPKFINDLIYDDKVNLFRILTAINSNYIITTDMSNLFRLNGVVGNYKKKCTEMIPFDTNELHNLIRKEVEPPKIRVRKV